MIWSSYKLLKNHRRFLTELVSYKDGLYKVPAKTLSENDFLLSGIIELISREMFAAPTELLFPLKLKYISLDFKKKMTLLSSVKQT